MVKVPSSDPFGGGGYGDGGGMNRRERRAQRKLDRPHAGDEVHLTPKGRALFDLILRTASEEAGRQLTGENILDALGRVRAETGIHDVDLSEPEMLECFKKHLRAIGSSG